MSLAAAGTAAVAVQPALASAAGGSGASLPYVEVQAEDSATNGTVIGPGYTQGQLADEASGRKAVTLQGADQYVTFTTPVAANSIDFRYSIPDSPDGSVYAAPLSLYVNGVKQAGFTVTNAYSWYYGSYRRRAPGRQGPRRSRSSGRRTAAATPPWRAPPPTPSTPPPETRSPSRSRPGPATSTSNSTSPPTASRTARRSPSWSSSGHEVSQDHRPARGVRWTRTPRDRTLDAGGFRLPLGPRAELQAHRSHRI